VANLKASVGKLEASLIDPERDPAKKCEDAYPYQTSEITMANPVPDH
jgi:hypothetical protein